LGGTGTDAAAGPPTKRKPCATSSTCTPWWCRQGASVSGAFQRFVVVKILKGDGPHVVSLRVAERPADVGRLHLLFLHPQSQPSAAATPAPVPSTTEATSTLDSLAMGAPVMYSYQGVTAMARELPAGTDPGMVTLP